MPFEWIDYDRQRTSLEVVGTNTNNILFLKETFEDRLSTNDQLIENITDQLNGTVEEINDLEDRLSTNDQLIENITDQLNGTVEEINDLEDRLSTNDQLIENITDQLNGTVEEINDLEDRVYVLENKPEILVFEKEIEFSGYFEDYQLSPTNNYVIRVIGRSDATGVMETFIGSAIWGPLAPPENLITLKTNSPNTRVLVLNMGQGHLRIMYGLATYTVILETLPQIGG